MQSDLAAGPQGAARAAAGGAAEHRRATSFFDFYEPANQVGGDYYDYIELPGGRLAVVLADVSGKGVSAALLMAKLSGEVRFCLASEPTPAAAMNRINASFSRSGWEDRFVTFVLAVLDPPAARGDHRQRRAHAAAAAARQGERRSDRRRRSRPAAGRRRRLPTTRSTRAPLAPGDFLTMFTDGISEAMNAEGELYGLERLRDQVGAERRQRRRARPSDPRRRQAVRRRPSAERRHVPGLLRPHARAGLGGICAVYCGLSLDRGQSRR